MLTPVALEDLRTYIKRKIVQARYRVGNTYYPTMLNDVRIMTNGTVRAQLSIIPSGGATINRVELYSNNGELWAYQDVNITVAAGQTGVLYWFDFNIVEKEA